MDKKLSLGIEIGSTNIKSVLLDGSHAIVAQGSYTWENKLIDGVWTYDLDDVWVGLQASYKNLKSKYEKKLGKLDKIHNIGISAMMHGYLVFDKNDNQLYPFKTWRNTDTGPASERLSELFNFNIPLRWSIAHLYQAILNDEPHVKDIAYITTLAGYVHWKLTGEKTLGIGDASGMFPIDPKTKNYNQSMLEDFHNLAGTPWNISDILPAIKVAGQYAGTLTEKGIKLLDVNADLQPGSIFCPPEGDAGTGMVATNSIKKKTGNISAGTSVFAMIVLEKELSKTYKDVDIVTTPSGDNVAMIHVNNCTSEINEWVNIFNDFLAAIGGTVSKEQLYEILFKEALKGDADAGGILAYGYLSGEHITKVEHGRPMLIRRPDARLDLSNLMRAQLYSAFATLHIGMKVLIEQEKVDIDTIVAHGGIFKTKGVADYILANALNTEVYTMETASEGGAWGIAVLASYLNASSDQNLEDYLEKEIFGSVPYTKAYPTKHDTQGFNQFVNLYENSMPLQIKAGQYI